MINAAYSLKFHFGCIVWKSREAFKNRLREAFKNDIGKQSKNGFGKP